MSQVSVRALERRMKAARGAQCTNPPGGLPGINYRQALQDDHDRSRTVLAVELLKIKAETVTVSSLTEAAKECLAAATEIFPELPDEPAAEN